MKCIILACLLLFCITSFAQQGINYKAVVKDGSGAIVANSLIQVQFIILDGVTNVYEETQVQTTDSNGFVILNIGEGTPIGGSDFSIIDWSTNDHSLNVQINTGGGLQDMGTTGLKTVPYAFQAETAANVKIVDGTEGAGKVLTDLNGDGIASWQPTATELPASPQAGDVAYHNGAGWQLLSPGIDGQILTLSSGLPTWSDIIDVPTNPSALQIGDIHEGGYIFYLDGSGEHGLVVSLAALAPATWGCHGTLVGASGVLVGDGQANTTTIVNNACHLADGETSAAEACDSYDDGTYDDWFLPSRDELNLMWVNLADSDGNNTNTGPADPGNLGNFTATEHWSSSEAGSGIVLTQIFDDGTPNGSGKFVNQDIRAVRAF